MTDQPATEIHGHGTVRRLQTRKTIAAPIETVWASLTDIDHVRRWWADGHIGSKAGDAVRLPGEDVHGTIVAWFKPHVFEFTWHDNPAGATHPEWIDAATNSLVRFDLIEVGPARTMLNLVTLAPLEAATGAAAGWHHLMELFVAHVEGRDDVDRSDERFEALKLLYPV